MPPPAAQSLLAPRAASELIARLQARSDGHDPLASLTPHKRDVLLLIREGLSNRQIGERLLLAEKTVKNYVSMMFRKLGIEQRTAAAAYVARTSTAGRPDRTGP